jgi:3-oxoacyl-[acyl-carrier protein] reductase
VRFTSGQYSHSAIPGELPYIASKGALHQLRPSLAVHLIPRGITVNCVDPGPNDTARLVAWLVSDEADLVTGQVITSDGGWSAAG